MKSKRLLCLASALVMLVLVLAGCRREVTSQSSAFMRVRKLLVEHDATVLGYLTIGDGEPTTAQTEGDKSLYVGGNFENDGISRFDGTIATNFVFEGATADAYETTLAITDPTADRTVTVPDETGAMMMSSLATNSTAITNSVTGASNALVYEGATADAYETSLSVTDPTTDRSVVFADDAGTVMLSSLATNATAITNSVTGASNALVWEGATADAFETSVVSTDPTADRTITLPDATGTVHLDISTQALVASTGTFADTVTVSDGDVIVADDLRVTEQTFITVTNTTAFTATGTYQSIRAAGEVTPTITVGTAGDLLILINESAQTINIADTGIQMLSAAWVGGQYDTLMLWCDGTNWLELSRSNN